MKWSFHDQHSRFTLIENYLLIRKYKLRLVTLLRALRDCCRKYLMSIPCLPHWNWLGHWKIPSPLWEIYPISHSPLLHELFNKIIIISGKLSWRLFWIQTYYIHSLELRTFNDLPTLPPFPYPNNSWAIVDPNEFDSRLQAVKMHVKKWLEESNQHGNSDL